MTKFRQGDFLPAFTVGSSLNPNYSFDTLAGHRVLLAFVGSGCTEKGARLGDALIALKPMLKASGIHCFVVTADPRDRDGEQFERVRSAFTVFWDFDRAIHVAYGMTLPGPRDPGLPPHLRIGAFLIRENLRLQTFLPATPLETLPDRVGEAVDRLGPVPAFTPVLQHAPVLIVPEFLDSGFCRHLIDYYEGDGGMASGFMRDVDGMTRPLLDAKMKRRRDCIIRDKALLDELRLRLHRRLVPEIRKAFAFNATRIERFIVGCYDGSERGFFRAHRDNTSLATAHRRFAVTVNLNAEEYEGGDLWFPEYGRRLYKAASGDAVVFSCSLLHEARPVERGRRYAFLPFLYDDTAAQIRAGNRSFLMDGPATPIEQLGAA